MGKLWRVRGSILVGVLLLAGCSGGSAGAGPEVRAAETAPATTKTEPSPAASAAPSPSPDPACQPGDGRTVTDLPDVAAPAVQVAAVTFPAQDVGGTTIPARTVPAFTIPARTIDAGCIVRYDAPAGCIGAVEITGVTIPAVSIPQRVIPAVTLPDGSMLPAETLAEVDRPAETRAGVRREQVCRLTKGRISYTVNQIGLNRIGLNQIGINQLGATQLGKCVAQACTAGVSLPGVSVDGVSVDGVSVDGITLPAKLLPAEKDVQVVTGDDGKAYLAPGDVLFATDRATLRPAAKRVLTAVARQLATAPAGSAITVEGHTDSRAGDSYNLALSRRRAQAVADWLERNASIEGSRLTVRGLGESAPVASNTTAAGRQQNRRVVIGVRTS